MNNDIKCNEGCTTYVQAPSSASELGDGSTHSDSSINNDYYYDDCYCGSGDVDNKSRSPTVVSVPLGELEKLVLSCPWTTVVFVGWFTRSWGYSIVGGWPLGDQCSLSRLRPSSMCYYHTVLPYPTLLDHDYHPLRSSRVCPS